MNLIQPLNLGPLKFPINLIQGPLAGISCAPFRYLTWKYSQPAYSCTEMISCKTLIHQSKALQKRFVTLDEREGPVSFQLSSNNPQELGEASKIVTEYGASLIDLNCGCPVKKIRSKGAGSSLLMQPLELYKLIQSMKQNTHLPVSIKIRVEGNSTDQFNQEIAKVVTEAGADFIVVHGRHWTEHYETPCNYQQIQFFVENMKIPVIGNGDVACLDSLKKMLATGCAGVMIGRAGVGQPWLINKLISELEQKPFSMPDSVEIGEIFIEHIERLVSLLASEKFAILQARKFAKYYARGLENRIDFHLAISQINSFQKLESITREYFKTSEQLNSVG